MRVILNYIIRDISLLIICQWPGCLCILMDIKLRMVQKLQHQQYLNYFSMISNLNMYCCHKNMVSNWREFNWICIDHFVSMHYKLACGDVMNINRVQLNNFGWKLKAISQRHWNVWNTVGETFDIYVNNIMNQSDFTICLWSI